jgi:hypothetical protein
MVFGMERLGSTELLQNFDQDRVTCPECRLIAKRMKDRTNVIEPYEGKRPTVSDM